MQRVYSDIFIQKSLQFDLSSWFSFVATPSDQRLWNSPKTSSILGWSKTMWPQQMSLWAMTSPTLNLATVDFQDRCWVWLSCRYVLLPQHCLLLPRPEVTGQQCHDYLISCSLRQPNSQSKVPIRRYIQEGVSFGGHNFFIQFWHKRQKVINNYVWAHSLNVLVSHKKKLNEFYKPGNEFYKPKAGPLLTMFKT